MITIVSRNCDSVRVTHQFPSAEALREDLTSEDPSMGDNEILLVTQEGIGVLYCSLGRQAKTYNDTVRTDDILEWFT